MGREANSNYRCQPILLFVDYGANWFINVFTNSDNVYGANWLHINDRFRSKIDITYGFAISSAISSAITSIVDPNTDVVG